MQASASKDSTKKSYAMYGAAEKISEGMLTLMQSFGIQELTCTAERSAACERMTGNVKHFAGTPQEIIDASLVVKDSLASIIAAAGVLSISISADDSDTEQLVESYKTLVKMAADSDAGNESNNDKPSDSPSEPAGDRAGDDDLSDPVEVVIPEKKI